MLGRSGTREKQRGYRREGNVIIEPSEQRTATISTSMDRQLMIKGRYRFSNKFTQLVKPRRIGSKIALYIKIFQAAACFIVNRTAS